MAPINVIQLALISQTFSERRKNDLIRFNSLKLDGDTGKLIDTKSEIEYDYVLAVREGASFIIDCDYFDGNQVISTTPLGFAIYSLVSNEIIRDYISTFYIDNQRVINSIMEFLLKVGEDGHSYTRERLAKEFGHAFSSEQTWSNRLDITEHIMEMLVAMKTVSTGLIRGEAFISVSNLTKRHIDEKLYEWGPR